MLIFWIGTITFFGTYLLIASEKVNKTVAALLGSSVMLILVLPGPGHAGGNGAHASSVVEQSLDSAMNPRLIAQSNKYDQLDTYSKYANFDVIFTLAGMMLLVNLLSGTGLFQFVAVKCAKLARGSPVRTMILLVLATAVLSAFLDNVTTILLVAPVTLLVTTQLGVPAVPFLMALTMASNIGGTATLIGDPPNLIIGSIANLNFMAFLRNLTPVVLLILLLYTVCLWLYYSKRMRVTVEKRAAIMELNEWAAISDRHNLGRGGAVMIVTIIGFLIHGALGIQPCVVAMSGAALALAICKVNVDHALEKIEWGTLFFFMALFVLVCGAEECGLMSEIGVMLSWTADWPVWVTILSIMWVSAAASAVMNNVSFTAAMVSIALNFMNQTPQFAQNLELRNLLWWAIALAVCLGGNASLVGAAANLVTVGIAEKSNIKISFWDFMRYGLPVTVASLAIASLYILTRYWLL